MYMYFDKYNNLFIVSWETLFFKTIINKLELVTQKLAYFFFKSSFQTLL